VIFTSSEIAAFLSCRRKWNLTSHNRMGLSRKGRTAPALNIGRLVHRGLEEILDENELGAQAAMRDMAHKDTKASEDAYEDAVGTRWSDDERLEIEQEINLAVGMVDHHRSFYGSFQIDPLRAKVTETSFKVPIVGTEHHLAGTFDALATHCETGDIWIVDHKTYTSKPHIDLLEMSWQFRGYIDAARQLFPKERIGGVLYNGLKKKLPQHPKLLTTGKNKGRLSTAKTTLANCTYLSFCEAIDQNGQNASHYTSELLFLLNRKNPFFKRHWIQTSVQRQNAFTDDLVQVAHAMAACQYPYPTFGWLTCNGCRVKPLCDATENLEALPMSAYHRETYATTAALVLEPSFVSNLDDLA